MNTNTKHIYTDGAAPNNQNGCVLGGAGVAVLDSNGNIEATFSKPVNPMPGCKFTTNSRCELLAFREGLRLAKADDIIYSDSKYVVDGYNTWLRKWVDNGWRRSGNKPVEHIDLWQEIEKLKSIKKAVTVCWVKGHSKDYGNQLADTLARSSIRKAFD